MLKGPHLHPFCPGHRRESAQWMRCGWLPDVAGGWTLLSRCDRPSVSAAGFVSGVARRGSSRWTDGAEEVPEPSAVPHWGLPLTLSFPLFVTVSGPLMLESDDYRYSMVASLMPHVSPKVNLPNTYFWVTFLEKLFCHDTRASSQFAADSAIRPLIFFPMEHLVR